MGLLSMTGFGAARGEATLPDGAQLSAVCEVRTVNHRHLQAKIRLPQEFGALEPQLDKLIRNKLARGSVQVAIDVTRTGGTSAIDIDEAACERYMHLSASLAKRYDIAPVRDIRDLFSLPGVVVQARGNQAATSDDGPEAALVKSVALEALEALIAMRSVEGEAMARDLRSSAAEVQRIVKAIERLVPGILERHRGRLVERVAELSKNTATTEADLAREIALLSDKLDVSEEITRLESHLDQLATLLDKGGSIGRKLDFLAQEFFREANTIGSKCSDSEVAHLVVDLKTHVERLREQVQNVE